MADSCKGNTALVTVTGTGSLGGSTTDDSMTTTNCNSKQAGQPSGIKAARDAAALDSQGDSRAMFRPCADYSHESLEDEHVAELRR